jgi:magnesium transporter
MKYLGEVKVRLTWLLIGLVMSLGIAQVIKSFSETLEANLILASFIPMIVYMSDAVGTQMEAMIIRELTNKKFKFLVFFKKQFLIVFTVALIVGIVAGLLVGYIDDSSSLGVVIGLSLFFGILSSLVTGTLIPYMFWKMHDDPAEASGPIATVIQDTLSVIIFFTIAQALL